MSTPNRLSLLASGVVIAGAVTLAVSALRAPSGSRAVAPGRCEVTWSLSLGTDPADLPHALAAHGGALWAATVNPAVGIGPRSARVRLLRVIDGQRYTEAMTAHAGSADAVTSWVRDASGVHLAVGAGRAVRLLSPLASGARERAFPQGPADPARDARTPSLALSLEPDGTATVLARWASFAPRRWRLRDAYESPAWLPPRPDVVAAPDMVLAGDTLLVAQARRAGGWSRAGEGPSQVELASLATDPFRTETPRVITLSRLGVAGYEPRVALLDPADPARGAVVAWRDAVGVALARAEEASSAWQPREFMRASDEPGDLVRAVDVAPIAGACGSLVAWRRGDVVALRAADVTAGRAGPVVTVQGALAREGARVRVERAGARTWVAFDGADGARLVEVTQDATCALTARAVNLPRAFPRGARVAGFAGDRARAVLAVTAAAPDAASTPLFFATLDGASGALRAAPPAETVAQGVTELSVFDAPVAVVMGRGMGSVRLQRVGDQDDDGEAGEDLVLREARGEDAALLASAAHHRVWVADVSGPVAAQLRPARAVIVHSAIEALEDGPRVEVPTAEPPSLDAGRLTLDAVTVQRDGRDVPAWATTMSGSTGEACVPGAWALLRRADGDEALPLRAPGDPWPHARALIPSALARCGDRVLSVTWEGTRVAAIVRGEGVGTRLVLGDIDAGAPRDLPLETSAARVLSASVVRLGRGLLALWTVREGTGAVLRYRRFDADGAPVGPAAPLGELLAAEDDTRASRMASAATAPTEAATALATTHGPRVFHVRCGER